MNNLITNINNSYHEQHPFHLVQPSVRPFFVSWSLFFCVLCLLEKMHPSMTSISGFFFYHMPYWPIPLLIQNIRMWFYEISNESNVEKAHTRLVQQGIALGMVLFIASEVMFFFAFFWAVFHFSVSPAITVGAVWPSAGLQTIYPFGIPLINTILLLSSGITLTLAHRFLLEVNTDPALQWKGSVKGQRSFLHRFYSQIIINQVLFNAWSNTTKHMNACLRKTPALLINKKISTRLSLFLNKLSSVGPITWASTMLFLTIILGVTFLVCQAYEYLNAPYTILDGAYASIFFLATGFHGFHVLCGTVFLLVCLILMRRSYYSSTRHISFELAAWYWHFVDVVWILLYICLYCLSPIF